MTEHSISAAHLAEDYWSQGPMTATEEVGWRDDLTDDDNMAVLRMRRFLSVRGAPGHPAAQPDVWSAMLRHAGWRAWYGLGTFPEQGDRA